MRIVLTLLMLTTTLFSQDISYPVSFNNNLGEIRDSVLFYCNLPTHPTPGELQMPYRKIRFLLPPDVNKESISVSLCSPELEHIRNDKIIKVGAPFSSEGVTIPIEVNRPNVANPQFPQSHIYTYRVFKKRQFKILEVTLFPYTYNYNTRELTLLKRADITVTHKLHRDTTPLYPFPKRTVKQIEKLVVNYDSAIMYYTQSVWTSRANNYHIITTRSIKNSLQNLDDFIQNKINRGFKVTVVTEEEWGGGTGNSAADNLRNWLETNYLSDEIDFVLLIGDPTPSSGNMAMKIAHAYYSGKKAPTDFYFAELSGNWDADGDGKFGETDDLDTKKSGGIDAVADISVGRIPYYSGDASKVDAILEKIITYETEKKSTTSWRNNLLLAMDGYYGNEGPEVGEKIYGDVLSSSSTQWDAYRIYCSSKGSPDKSSTSMSNVTNAWAPGQFGVVSWLTHGKEDAAMHIMDVTYAKQLSNQYPSIVMMGSCLNGKPDVPYNLAYTILQKGGIAVVSGSETTIYRQPMGNFVGSSYNHGFIHSFTTKVARDRELVIDALDRTRTESDMGCWKNYCAFNLYGDPSIGLDVAGITVDIQKSTSNVKNSHLEITGGRINLNTANNGKLYINNLKGQLVSQVAISDKNAIELKDLQLAKGVYIAQLQFQKSTERAIFHIR